MCIHTRTLQALLHHQSAYDSTRDSNEDRLQCNMHSYTRTADSTTSFICTGQRYNRLGHKKVSKSIHTRTLQSQHHGKEAIASNLESNQATPSKMQHSCVPAQAQQRCRNTSNQIHSLEDSTHVCTNTGTTLQYQVRSVTLPEGMDFLKVQKCGQADARKDCRVDLHWIHNLTEISIRMLRRIDARKMEWLRIR